MGVELRRPVLRGARGGDSCEDSEVSLLELKALAESAGARVLDCVVQTRDAPDAATLVGSGKLTEIAQLAQAQMADVVIFDRDLSPTQLRNLEKALPCKVIDRTQLILDIFARRARTREGQLQVELAQLNYLLPRLTGRGAAMSRLGGGIGTRGPGETQLETDRRRIYRRIRKIEADLESVRETRLVQRGKRQAAPMAAVALVGYTNAGKSSLFNRLSGAEVAADARMFATLDTTVRQLHLPSKRRAIVSDTVGFVSNLPATLIKAFRATLEEVTQSSLLLHVVDISSGRAAQQTAHVLSVLAEIGASGIPQILVLNKVDLLPPEERDAKALARRSMRIGGSDAGGVENTVAVSARTGEGLEELVSIIDRLLPLDPVRRVCYRFPLDAAAQLHRLYEQARVLRCEYAEDSIRVEAEVPESLARQFGGYEVCAPRAVGPLAKGVL